jgi:hypothetical protein
MRTFFPLLVIPHAIEVGARGRPQRLRIVVETVDNNPRIDDERFKTPSRARR